MQHPQLSRLPRFNHRALVNTLRAWWQRGCAKPMPPGIVICKLSADAQRETARVIRDKTRFTTFYVTTQSDSFNTQSTHGKMSLARTTANSPKYVLPSAQMRFTHHQGFSFCKDVTLTDPISEYYIKSWNPSNISVRQLIGRLLKK